MDMTKRLEELASGRTHGLLRYLLHQIVWRRQREKHREGARGSGARSLGCGGIAIELDRVTDYCPVAALMEPAVRSRLTRSIRDRRCRRGQLGGVIRLDVARAARPEAVLDRREA